MKAWRESASLIVAARTGLKFNQPYNYKVLFLKRQKNAKFANTFVFPGGIIESSDASLKWKNLFINYGFNENHFKSLLLNTMNRPEIFHENKENELPREMSLRITAIRETFEECGILICNKFDKCKGVFTAAHHFPISIDDINIWQDKVHNDANEFYNMCEQLQCYPNLWALHEWGNWLTITSLPNRFDTAFFFVGLPGIPNSKLEQGEVEELIWETPEQMIKLNKKFLLVPQFYETTKLGKFKDFEILLQFAQKARNNGIQRYLPIKVHLLDGAVLLLPGDSMYPEKVDPVKKEFLDKSHMTIEQFRHASPHIHRIEVTDGFYLQTNFSFITSKM